MWGQTLRGDDSWSGMAKLRAAAETADVVVRTISRERGRRWGDTGHRAPGELAPSGGGDEDGGGAQRARTAMAARRGRGTVQWEA